MDVYKMMLKRKSKEKVPVLAICYDFDKTLSPQEMQAQGFIQSIGQSAGQFWEGTNQLAELNGMDGTLAYMYKMLKEAKGSLTKQSLMKYGADIRFYPGVMDWFDRIREYGRTRNIMVEHYIISTGLKEMIEGTEIARKGVFEEIYASSFMYNEEGTALWPAQAVNYTGKTQFLFRIQKGILDINDQGVNEYYAPETLRVPFRNMIYIGDSETDVPCMKLVHANGGCAIGVYDPETGDKNQVLKLAREERIRYYAAADYREGSKLDLIIKDMIDGIANES